jgi:hypothetical protein
VVKKSIQTGLLLLVAAVAVLVLYQRLFPNEERTIRQRLQKLAEVVSIPDQPTTAGNLAAGDRLRDFLAADLTLQLEVPGESRHSLTGRQEAIQAFVAARASLAGLRVQFLDLQVVVDPGRQTATVNLTARATQAGQQDFWVQELTLRLRKDDRLWRLVRVETVRALQL